MSARGPAGFVRPELRRPPRLPPRAERLPPQARPERGALGLCRAGSRRRSLAGSGGARLGALPRLPRRRASAAPSPAATAGPGRGCWWATARTSCSAPSLEAAGDRPGWRGAGDRSRASGSIRRSQRRAGARWRPLGPRADLALPLDELEAEIERDPRRPLLLCTPNNPTGDAADRRRRWRGCSPGWRRRCCSTTPTASSAATTTGPLLDRHPNLVLFRTFSKAWSLAGLRLGYLLAASASWSPSWSRSSCPTTSARPGIEAGCAALEAPRTLARRVRLLRRAESAVGRACWPARGLEVFPSEANFLLVRCRGGAEASRTVAATGSAERGILVRDVGALPGPRRLPAGLGGQRCGRAGAAAAVAEILGAERAVAAATRRPGDERSLTQARRRAAAGRAASARPARRGCAVVDRRSTARRGIRRRLPLECRPRRIEVPNGFFRHMLEALATHAGFGLAVEAAGDIEVDLHHTVEDVGIALGEALAAALGERRGIVRFAHAYAPLDEALARAVVDLSGRGFFAWRGAAGAGGGVGDAGVPADPGGRLLPGVRRSRAADAASGPCSRRATATTPPRPLFKAVALALRQAVAVRGGRIARCRAPRGR